MANLREIKRRIKTVRSTQQITRAMQMVAAAKVRRAQERVTAARPYAEKVEALLRKAVAKVSLADIGEPLLAVRPVKKVAIIVFSSDKGLCGSYNTNILKKALARVKEWQDKGAQPTLLLVGTKAVNFFKSVPFPVMTRFTHLPSVPTFGQAQAIIEKVVQAYLGNEVDHVELVYTRFVSMIKFQPEVLQLLPVQTTGTLATPTGKGAGTGPIGKDVEYLFEPSAEAVISSLLPKYLETLVYRAFLEANASELAARMTAMSAATKNAGEMISHLTLVHNKARQASITQEILEIVGGAEALKG